jgi:hypothetical protein
MHTEMKPAARIRAIFGPDAVRRSRDPIGVPVRVVELDEVTAFVMCSTLPADQADAALARALDAWLVKQHLPSAAGTS